MVTVITKTFIKFDNNPSGWETHLPSSLDTWNAWLRTCRLVCARRCWRVWSETWPVRGPKRHLQWPARCSDAAAPEGGVVCRADAVRRTLSRAPTCVATSLFPEGSAACGRCRAIALCAQAAVLSSPPPVMSEGMMCIPKQHSSHQSNCTAPIAAVN